MAVVPGTIILRRRWNVNPMWVQCGGGVTGAVPSPQASCGVMSATDAVHAGTPLEFPDRFVTLSLEP